MNRALVVLVGVLLLSYAGAGVVFVSLHVPRTTQTAAAAGDVDIGEPKTCEEAKKKALRGEQLNDGPARGSVTGTIVGKTELDKCFSAFMTPMGFLKKQKGIPLSLGDYECKGRKAVTNVETGKVTDISVPARELGPSKCQRTVQSEKPKDASGKPTPTQPQQGGQTPELPKLPGGGGGGGSGSGGGGEQSKPTEADLRERLDQISKESEQRGLSLKEAGRLTNERADVEQKLRELASSEQQSQPLPPPEESTFKKLFGGWFGGSDEQKITPTIANTEADIYKQTTRKPASDNTFGESGQNSFEPPFDPNMAEFEPSPTKPTWWSENMPAWLGGAEPETALDQSAIGPDAARASEQPDTQEEVLSSRSLLPEEARKALADAKLYQEKVRQASVNVDFDRDFGTPTYDRALEMKQDAERRVAEAQTKLDAVERGEDVRVPLQEAPKNISPEYGLEQALYDGFAKAIPESSAVGEYASGLEASDKIILKDVSQWLIDRGVETPKFVENNLQSYIDTGDFPGLRSARDQAEKGEGSWGGALRSFAHDSREVAAQAAAAIPETIKSWSDLGDTIVNGTGWLASSALEMGANTTANLMGLAGYESFNPSPEIALDNVINPNKAAATLVMDAANVAGIAYPAARAATDLALDAGIAATQATREGLAIAARDIAPVVGRETYESLSQSALDRVGASAVRIPEPDGGNIPYLVGETAGKVPLQEYAPTVLSPIKDDITKIPQSFGDVSYDAASGRPFMVQPAASGEAQLVTSEGEAVPLLRANREGYLGDIVQTRSQYDSVEREFIGSDPTRYSREMVPENPSTWNRGFTIKNSDGTLREIDESSYENLRAIGDNVYGVTAARDDLIQHTRGKFEVNSPGDFAENTYFYLADLGDDFSTYGKFLPMSASDRAELIDAVSPYVKTLPPELWENMPQPVRLEALRLAPGREIDFRGLALESRGDMWIDPAYPREVGETFYHEMQHLADSFFPADDQWARTLYGDNWMRAYSTDATENALAQKLGLGYRPEGFVREHGLTGPDEQKATFVEALFTNPAEIESAAQSNALLAKQLEMTREAFSKASDGVMNDDWWRAYKPIEPEYRLPPSVRSPDAEAPITFADDSLSVLPPETSAMYKNPATSFENFIDRTIPQENFYIGSTLERDAGVVLPDAAPISASEAAATRSSYLNDPIAQTSQYKEFPRLSLDGVDKEIQDAAIAKYLTNREALMQEYTDMYGTKVASGDSAKNLFKDLGYIGTNDDAVHEAGSALGKDVWRHNLATNPEKNAVVYTGGPGAGKSSAIQAVPDLEADASAIMDGSFSKGSVDARIAEARAAGKTVDLVYVYRDPIDAWENGVVSRMLDPAEGGRVTPLSAYLKGHENSWKTVDSFLQDAPEGVRVHLIDNSLGRGNQALMSEEKFYNIPHSTDSFYLPNLRNELLQRTQNLLDRGIITPYQYQMLTR